MKNLINSLILALFLFNSEFALSQNYIEAFDRIDNYIDSNGKGFLATYDNNYTGTISGTEAYLMRGYLNMYRATGDFKYLQHFLKQAKMIINIRDDNCNPPRVDYNGEVRATWISTSYTINELPYAFVLHSGNITYPLADFAQMVINDPNLWYIQDNDGEYFINTANMLVNRIHETIMAHEDQWLDGEENLQMCYDNYSEFIHLMRVMLSLLLHKPDAIIIVVMLRHLIMNMVIVTLSRDKFCLLI